MVNIDIIFDGRHRVIRTRNKLNSAIYKRVFRSLRLLVVFEGCRSRLDSHSNLFEIARSDVESESSLASVFATTTYSSCGVASVDVVGIAFENVINIFFQDIIAVGKHKRGGDFLAGKCGRFGIECVRTSRDVLLPHCVEGSVFVDTNRFLVFVCRASAIGFGVPVYEIMTSIIEGVGVELGGCSRYARYRLISQRAGIVVVEGDDIDIVGGEIALAITADVGIIFAVGVFAECIVGADAHESLVASKHSRHRGIGLSPIVGGVGKYRVERGTIAKHTVHLGYFGGIERLYINLLQ